MVPIVLLYGAVSAAFFWSGFGSLETESRKVGLRVHLPDFEESK
jgi:hypothetical protein